MESLIKEILEYRSPTLYNSYIYSTIPIEKGIEMHLWARWKKLKDKYKPGE